MHLHLQGNVLGNLGGDLGNFGGIAAAVAGLASVVLGFALVSEKAGRQREAEEVAQVRPAQPSRDGIKRSLQNLSQAGKVVNWSVWQVFQINQTALRLRPNKGAPWKPIPSQPRLVSICINWKDVVVRTPKDGTVVLVEIIPTYLIATES